MNLLLQQRPTILCLQEFWYQNKGLFDLYRMMLRAAGYSIFITPRTNNRGDSLLTAVSDSEFTVLNILNLPFNDCGDRVAHLLHLRAAGAGPGPQEMLLVNTHLMFPHNHNSHVIRLRQCMKMLDYLRRYAEENALPHLPIIVCGDWNGPSNGHVGKFMQSQGFIPVLDTHYGYACKADTASQAASAPPWVTHLNHNGEAVAADCIWLLNPASYNACTLMADWRDAACASIVVALVRQGYVTQVAGWSFFDEKGQGCLTLKDFGHGVQRLGGMTGKGSTPLSTLLPAHWLPQPVV